MSFPFPEAKIYKAKEGLARYRTAAMVKGWSMWFLLYKVVFRLADQVFVQSEQMKADVAKHGIPHERLTPVLMGIRTDAVRTAEAARKPNTERLMLLYLGTLERSRHIEILVDVLVLVKKIYPTTILYIVGGGDAPGDEEFIKLRAQERGVLDSVVLTGIIDREKAWDLVEQADICFSPINPIPPLLPASSTKLIEYLAMAKCVVANDHPEMTQVMRDSGVGQTVPWGVDAFAAEVFRLLGDPAASQDAAARGPDYVRSHRTYDVIAAKVDSAYRQLLAGGRAQP
jgi:glycosyltransferase involved in cell wall biosynthesis